MPPTVAAARTDAVLIHPADNVAVAIRPLPAGTVLDLGGRRVTLTGPIKPGHKVALAAVARGERVVKYGQPIGVASEAIEPGAWVHAHNLINGNLTHDYQYSTEVPPDPTPLRDRTFQGYRRADGRVGTRNYLAIISTVNCSATVSRAVEARAAELLRQYPHVDGVFALTHGTGCGLQYGGEDHEQLNRVLAGFARHPNVGGYLLIGLGCETAAMPYLVERSGLVQIGQGTRTLPPILSIQECGGTQRTIEAALRTVGELLPRLDAARRETVPASALVLGLNCGGSDGNSGITANPALGVASDLLVAAGGTTVLAETPETYGAEHLLTRRARSPEVGRKLVERIEWWKRYTAAFGVEMDNNPSPGNKEGGLTTIFEKSLGAMAKAGTTALQDVVRYAEPVTSKGFVFMDTPGLDPASVTGLVAGGANVVCFTTGRGSCFGCKPTPSIKIATNTPLYERMPDDMDLNAGVVLEGVPVADVGRTIFDSILDVASGRRTKSEQLGYGEEEIVPWSIGPTL